MSFLILVYRISCITGCYGDGVLPMMPTPSKREKKGIRKERKKRADKCRRKTDRIVINLNVVNYFFFIGVY